MYVEIDFDWIDPPEPRAVAALSDDVQLGRGEADRGRQGVVGADGDADALRVAVPAHAAFMVRNERHYR